MQRPFLILAYILFATFGYWLYQDNQTRKAENRSLAFHIMQNSRANQINTYWREIKSAIADENLPDLRLIESKTEKKPDEISSKNPPALLVDYIFSRPITAEEHSKIVSRLLKNPLITQGDTLPPSLDEMHNEVTFHVYEPGSSKIAVTIFCRMTKPSQNKR